MKLTAMTQISLYTSGQQLPQEQLHQKLSTKQNRNRPTCNNVLFPSVHKSSRQWWCEH